MQQMVTFSSPEEILSRLNAMTREIEVLRRFILGEKRVADINNETDNLLGVLGSEAITDYDYDYDLDWNRFGLI